MLRWGDQVNNWPISYIMKIKNSICLDYIKMKLWNMLIKCNLWPNWKQEESKENTISSIKLKFVMEQKWKGSCKKNPFHKQN